MTMAHVEPLDAGLNEAVKGIYKNEYTLFIEAKDSRWSYVDRVPMFGT